MRRRAGEHGRCVRKTRGWTCHLGRRCISAQVRGSRLTTVSLVPSRPRRKTDPEKFGRWFVLIHRTFLSLGRDSVHRLLPDLVADPEEPGLNSLSISRTTSRVGFTITGTPASA